MSKGTIILSNLPGPRKAYQFDGFKSKGIAAILPASPQLMFALLAVSHEDSFYLTICSDAANQQNPAGFRDLFMQNYAALKALLDQGQQSTDADV